MYPVTPTLSVAVTVTGVVKETLVDGTIKDVIEGA